MLRRWTTVLQVMLLILGILFSITPIKTLAASNSLVIYQLQTGATSAATQEFISLFNISDQPLDISGWCVIYASSSDVTQTQLGCFASPNASTRLLLPSHKTATLASSEFNTVHPGFIPDILFNAGMSGTSGHVRVLDNEKHEVDVLGWGSALHPEGIASIAHQTGKILQRSLSSANIPQDTDNNATDFMQTTLSQLPATSLEEEIIPTDVCPNIVNFQDMLPGGYLLDSTGNCQQDVCVNLAGLQQNIPDGYSLENVDCILTPLESSILDITELLPNVAGSDAGKEFIEVFNPNNHAVGLKGYTLQTGSDYAKSYNLPDIIIASMHYLALSDDNTGVVLPNTTGFLRLLAPNGDVVSTVSPYEDPKNDRSWSKFGDSWAYSTTTTPNATNILTTNSECNDCDISNQETSSSLTACRADQERNPETNRCRLIQTAIASLSPCKPGQERNPETNRCRSLDTDSSSLVPCKEGQERNAETNRCRATQVAVLGACDEGQERSPETNRCRKSTSGVGGGNQLAKVQDIHSGSITKNPRWWIILIAITGAIGYAIFEWRNEASMFVRRFLPVKKA